MSAGGWELLCLGVLVYVYVGYPLVCWVLGRLWPRPWREDTTWLPRVSVLIAAHDEVDCIGATVRNKLEQDYPPDRLEVIVVSDGSTDGTDEAVAELAAAHPDRVRLLRQERRAGKTAALNRAREVARGEVLVFADANSLYGTDAVRHLVAALADPDVGYVTGRMLYRAEDGSLTGEGCSAYMAYENRLRDLESRFGSVVGVDGGIDAIRAKLYVPMRADLQPDFVLPMAVVAAGRRVVYTPDARLYEDALDRADNEFRMRVRVILRAWHALWHMRRLLWPGTSGLYAWQLWSHKVLRYLAPLALLGMLGAGAAAAPAGGVWAGLLAGQAVFYAAAALALAWPVLGRNRLLMIPSYFTLINAAALVALLQFLAGRQQVTWTPRT